VAIRAPNSPAILKNEGIDGTDRGTERKADVLTGTAARSF